MDIVKVHRKDTSFRDINKRQRIPKGQSKRDNPEKLATHAVCTRPRQKKKLTTFVKYVLDTNIHK